MYVQIDQQLRSHIMVGVSQKLEASFQKWQSNLALNHPGLAWKILQVILPTEYHQFWELHDKVHRRKPSSGYYNDVSANTMHIATSLERRKQLALPIDPHLRLLYGRSLENYAEPDLKLTMEEVLKIVPEIQAEFDILKAMDADQVLLMNAMNSALQHSSLGVALNKAPFLREFVPVYALEQLAAKAVPKPKQAKVVPKDLSPETQEALLVAATRLKIQD